MDSQERKYLADVIDYKRDIDPYHIIQVYSGVGSGKNTFVEKLIMGEIEGAPKGQKILLITSRRAKVDETIAYYDGEKSLKIFCERIGLAGNIFVRRWYKEEREEYKDNLFIIPDQENAEHHIYQDSVVCTSAMIAAYFRYCYDFSNVNTYLWEKFDMIVVDEAHSLIADATYQEAPFYIDRLIKHYMGLCSKAVSDPDNNRMPNCKHLLLMTGTPMFLPDYMDLICPKNVRMNMIDVRKECINVVPKQIRFIEQRYVKKIIADKIQDGKKIIYFSNNTRTVNEFCEKTSIPKDKAAASFAKLERREDLKEYDADAYEEMVFVEDSIKREFKIPDKYNLFITTSKYKEGINIFDDIDYMFIESHVSSDVIQMAGRVRNGVKVLYIVVDAKPHRRDFVSDELNKIIASNLCSNEYTVLAHNTAYNCDYDSPVEFHNFIMPLLLSCSQIMTIPIFKLEDVQDLSEIELIYKYQRVILDFIEAKFPYMHYNCITRRFEYFELKSGAEDFNETEEENWEKMRQEKSLEKISEWFPDSEVIVSNEMYEAAWKYWKDNNIQINADYTQEEFMAFIQYWADLFDENPSRPKNVLKRFCNYEYKRCGDGNKKRRFIDPSSSDQSKRKKRQKRA